MCPGLRVDRREVRVDKDRRWVPRRRGKVYCSPACGRGCKYSDYRRAVAKAKSMRRALGPDWTAAVHENGGWFSRATSKCGRVYVLVSPRQYMALISRAPYSYGVGWVGHGDTPARAVANATALLEDASAELVRLVEEIRPLATKKRR